MDRVVTTATADEWLRSYAALSRSGVVTPTIAASEEEWSRWFFGNPAAVGAIREAPDYRTYVQALRAALPFPLALYRVCRDSSYRRWQRRPFSAPLAATMSLPIAEAFWHFRQNRNVMLLHVRARDPEAILMRGRPEGCELVIDPSRIRPDDVAPLRSALEGPDLERWEATPARSAECRRLSIV